MKVKIKQTLLGLTLALGLIVSPVAVEALTPVVNEATYVYGAGLSQSEVDATAKLLGATGSQIKAVAISAADLNRYVGGTSTDKSMISSALVRQGAENSGINVEIATPENITDVTAVQYANAAITAGAEDLNITVASPRKVTGKSALSGVYKAIEANGGSLDTDRMEVAQQELETVAEISKENEGDEGFKAQKFDQLIIQIKNELNIVYNNLATGDTISRDEIKKIINDTAKKLDLATRLKPEQIDRLTAVFEKYTNTDAISSGEVVDQLKDLSKSAVDRAKEIYADAEESGLLEKILKFIGDIFRAIIDFFKGLFGMK